MAEKTLQQRKADKERSLRKERIEGAGREMGLVPPQALDVEEAVLGAMMLEPGIVADALDSLSEECFYKDSHRRIFKAITSLAREHNPVDVFTVTERLKSQEGGLEEIGGAYALSKLTTKIGAATHIDYHIKLLVEKYIQRELISISSLVQKECFDGGIKVDDLLDNAQQRIFTLAERNMKRETMSIQDVLKDTIAQIESNRERSDGLSGVASGFVGLDEVTLGWQASDLVIVAARPAMGKTAFVLTMARNMAVEHHTPVAFFSLEMSSQQLAKRLIVSETGISNEKIRGGGRALSDAEIIQLNERVKNLASSPLYIDDTPALSLYEFRSKARKLVRSQGVKLIIIDYLQLMTGPVELRGMREQEVAHISRGLKSIAKELNIPILALSQLSRAVEVRGGNKRPQLSDLRESGAIEQDADIVIFIHRPEYYGATENPADLGLAEIIIAKHRNGKVCDVKMRFLSSQTRFVDFNDTQYEAQGQDQYFDSALNSSDFDEPAQL